MPVSPRDSFGVSAVPPRSSRIALEGFSVAIVTIVAMVTAAFAAAFRALIMDFVDLLSGVKQATVAARLLPSLEVFAVVTGGLLVAAWIGRRAQLVGDHRLGLTGVAAAARGDGPGPSGTATMMRSTGTLVASSCMASIGREGAIIEGGGTIGFSLARRLHALVPALSPDLAPAVAAAGMAAAFATAYHAPLAAILYVELHFGVRHRRRAMVYTALGALIGHFTAVWLLAGKPILPDVRGPSTEVAVMGLIALIPVLLGSVAFLYLRTWACRPRKAAHVWWWVVAAAVAGGGIAVAFPDVAGNGLEPVRVAAVGASVSLAVALAIAKSLATAAALGSEAPGGAYSPSLAVATGWALLTFALLTNVGIGLPGAQWSGAVAAMAIGITVGLQAPLVALFAIPEMTGDVHIFPEIAVIVLATVVAQHVLTIGWRRIRRTPGTPIPELQDDDG